MSAAVLQHARTVTRSCLRSRVLHQSSASLSCSQPWRSDATVLETKDTKDPTNRLTKDEPFKSYAESSGNLKHFNQPAGSATAGSPGEDYTMPHPIWSDKETEGVQITHRKPEGVIDYAAYGTVNLMRFGFDLLSGYKRQQLLDTMDERAVLTRCIFLETVAGVPGFAAGMIRHLGSLRNMERDHGWIHTLIEEAENERMHLMTFLQLRRPGPLFKASVIGTQFIFTAGFSVAYMISPTFCHRFVGYLEEQAVVTYSDILDKLDSGKLPMWSKLPAPDIAVTYWKLGEAALMRDVILAIRADEAHHRVVNHTLGDMDLKQPNPFRHDTQQHFKQEKKVT